MEGYWDVRGVMLRSNELFLIKKLKSKEKIKRLQVQELYQVILRYNLMDRIYWEIIDDINRLEEEIEKSKKIRRALEGR